MFLHHIAEYWEHAENKIVYCSLCPHNCRIHNGTSGRCGMRKNRDGELIASGYGLISSIALDPIEKKPLYCFQPGKNILSVGGFGCNFHCQFCQNYEISLEYKERLSTAEILTPGELTLLAKRTIQGGNIGIAYTYNEPLIAYEFVRDTAKLIREAGLFNVLVTNGYINKAPLEALLPLIDAMNIDLKSFRSEFYKNVGGDTETVKENIALSRKHCHIEVTTLVIPGENEESIEELATWLASIDAEIPLHLSRFFPRYHYAEKQPTPAETIYKLIKTAKKYLKNVFVRNII